MTPHYSPSVRDGVTAVSVTLVITNRSTFYLEAQKHGILTKIFPASPSRTLGQEETTLSHSLPCPSRSFLAAIIYNIAVLLLEVGSCGLCAVLLCGWSRGVGNRHAE